MYNEINTNSRYNLFLILGIIQIFGMCCCNCISPIFGILTIVFISTASKALKTGDVDTYNKKMKIAFIMNVIGWVSIGVGIVLAIMTRITDKLVNRLYR